MRKGGENDDKGMVRDVEVVRTLGGREMLSSMRDGICVCVAVVVAVVVAALMITLGVVLLMVAVGVVALVIVVRVLCIGVVGVVGVLCIGAVEEDCEGMVDILVLGGVFVVEVVEGVEPVGCVVRLLLWCANGRGYFLCRYILKSVEMSGLTLGGFLFGMAIWANCFVLLECGFLSKMVDVDMLMDVVVELVVVEAMDLVQAGFFCLFPVWLFGGYGGCETGDTSCGWYGDVSCCGGLGVVGGGLWFKIGCRGWQLGNGEDHVVTSGGNVSVADGGGARWRDCGRFPYGICGRPSISSPIHARHRQCLFVGWPGRKR